MKTKNNGGAVRRCLILATLFGLALFAAFSPARPVLALPPRPEPPPTPNPVSGGGIELRVWSAQARSWDTVETVVQWQDGLGGWHDIEGWRGKLDQLFADGGRKTWFVSAELFGKGPFRWVVYEDDKTLATSDPFTMPSANGQTVRTLTTVGP